MRVLALLGSLAALAAGCAAAPPRSAALAREIPPAAALDAVSPSGLAGWACVPGVPGDGVRLVARANGAEVGRARFAVPRPDVLASVGAACGGWKAPGFELRFDPPLNDRTVLQLAIALPAGRELPFPEKPAVDVGVRRRETVDVTLGGHARRRRPLNVTLDDAQPVRLNILVCALGNSAFTGGPLSIMRFAVLASRAGFAVRWINVDGGGVPWADLATAAAKYPLLEKLADELEFVDDALGFSAGTPPPVVPANPGDLFMGTLFYTVLQARATVAAHPGLRNRNVVNFVQDDEGIFFPHGTSHLEAREAHAGPHFPIFSTDFLRSHFESNRVGLFAHCHPAECAELHFSAQPAIRPRAPFDPALFAPNRTRRLIMYARPLHDRNAFDLGVLALDEAVRRGIFGPRLEERWEFLGVGSHAEHADQCNLGGIRGMCLQMRPSVPEPEYFALLGTGDVGLALMVSPHPSLPPLDFAAAGMATVTNTWGSKTAEALRAAGGNLIPAEPTLEGLVAALEQAVARAEDVEGRMQGSRLDWPERWDDPRCYGAPLWRRMRRWFATTNALW